MKLLLAILVAGLLGTLAMFGPVGIYIICAIIVGVFFRSFILLNEIHKTIVPSTDKVKDAYDRYLKERDEKVRED